MGDISDMYSEKKVAVVQFPDGNRIIKILGFSSIDSDDGIIAQVSAAGDLFLRDQLLGFEGRFSLCAARESLMPCVWRAKKRAVQQPT